MSFIADLLCPERCAGCPTLVDPRALFCATCRASVHHLGPPECLRCGSPGSSTGPCPLCRTQDFPIRAGRAWAAYHGEDASSPVARAIASFKYGGAIRLGRRLARTMLPRIPDPEVCLVVPIPLHPRRLRHRGFNQSAVLARHLARAMTAEVALTAVTRIRNTASQVGLRSKERDANVARAFAVTDATRVRDRTILVVDDVWTSGATARAVATALRDAGAEAVDVLTIARVL